MKWTMTVCLPCSTVSQWFALLPQFARDPSSILTVGDCQYAVCTFFPCLCVFLLGALVSFHSLKYTPENVAGPEEDLDPTEISLPGCECFVSSCEQDACTCLQRYLRAYDENLCLVDFKETGYSRPVFECNIMCKCSEACKNRLVQRGLTFKLQVFKTSKKGWGLRTLEPIRRGRFVCEYGGEVISLPEASRRIRSQNCVDMNFIIAVREHLSNGKILETYVDPTHIGNVGRFLNHSCDPNLYMVPVRVNSLVPRLALFAARNIAAEEELSYDYSGKFNNLQKEGTTKERSSGKGRALKSCYCGAQSCTGFLPFDSSLYNLEDQSNVI
ncbi:histone-lysine N-methyltransferase SETMAR isoform X3 [Scyliorhinus canicula]|uniref:histone-lysine N-methyltransferase SETMAR isoform X3 n=1 Tax=Scyliorhinus canicula TaxID=7830 RepID=UPI0018F3B975|nr:histone-lysine N-methyltransferase SETMAR isoform X3 [Scyliorhinus canicula]